jgi:hypothetical protein
MFACGESERKADGLTNYNMANILHHIFVGPIIRNDPSR